MDYLSNMENIHWSEWRNFPNPDLGEYLCAPFGPGVYQLKNLETGELILFGKSKNVAYRMTSLLPPPHGTGIRKNMKKRLYVLEHIDHVAYRTLASNSDDASTIEKNLKKLNIHIFNS